MSVLVWSFWWCVRSWRPFCFVAGVLLMRHEGALLITRTCPVSDCRVIQVDLNAVCIAVNSMVMAQILKTAGGFNL